TRCRRRTDVDYPKRIPRQGQGTQLAARTQGAILHDHAPLLAERGSGGRQVDAASGATGKIIIQPINHRKYPIMKTTRSLNLLSAAFAAGLALTTIRAADITPAETKAIAEEGF